MTTRRHTTPDAATRQRNRLSRGVNSTMLVLAMLLGVLGLSLQSTSGVHVLSERSVTAGQPFAETPEITLAPSPTATPEPDPEPEPEPEMASSPSPSSFDPAADTADTAAAADAEVPAPAVVQAPATDDPAPPASAPQRITYAAAGIDVAVHPMEIDQSTQESQSIVPPFTLDGYWLSPFGTPGSGSTDTTYVVGHSWEDRDAPFNRLSSSARPGDEFTVTTAAGVLTYRVDSVVTFLKSTLKDSDIWNIRPNVIVLISCYTEDPWGKNVVVTASPVP